MTKLLLAAMIFIAGIIGIAHAGTITVTNLNSSFILNSNGVEAGFEQTMQFNLSGFTQYANQDVVLDVFLENQSAWWDKTNQQWDFPVVLRLDANGNFSYNWTLPFTEVVWPGVTIGAGQYVTAGLQRVALANGSVQGGLIWMKRNATLNAMGIFVNDSVYVGYAGGTVTAYNKTSVPLLYYGDNSYIWNVSVGTTQVEEVWADRDYVYAVQSTTTNGLRKLNATNSTLMWNATNPAAAYAIWGDTDFLYMTYAASTAPRKYNKTDLTQVTAFAPAAVAQIGYDVWANGERAYVCYANGSITGYNITTGAILWRVQNTTNACYGIFGDSESVYSGHANGMVLKYNKTDGTLAWNTTDYTYSTQLAAATTINSIWVNTNYVYALYSDGRILYLNKTDGTTGLFRHFAFHIPGSAQAGNSIYGDGDYVYAAHNSGWLFKIGQENRNFEWHPEADFWIRDLADTWNIIVRPVKPVFADNETMAFDFLASNNRTIPLNVTDLKLQGTYFYTRTSRHYNQWEAVTFTSVWVDPRISTAATPPYRWAFYNNLTTADCPATHYFNQSNQTGWYLYSSATSAAGAAWCLYHNATVPPPLLTTYNGTKLPTYELATVRPRPMVNNTYNMWYNILNGDIASNGRYENLTKYYGSEKYTWFAVFGTRPDTSLDPQNGVLGVVKKAGSDHRLAWADKFGRSDIWRVSRTGTTDSWYMYARYSLQQNATPFEFYWILTDWGYPWIASNVENATIAIANPVNVTNSSEDFSATGWTVDSNTFYYRKNITFREPNVINRLDEPVNFTFNPLTNISATCSDIRVVDDSSQLVTHQNETCSANSVNVWIYINLTRNEERNFTVYYNSTAPGISFQAMNVTVSGSCPTQTIGLWNMNLAYDTNYSKSYNWSQWGVDTNENITFNFGNTSRWAVTMQNNIWAFNNASGPAAVAGWNERCLLQTGPVFTKMSMNQTGMAASNGVNLDIFGTVYVFQKSGRVKIIMQPNGTVVDPIDSYPAYYRYGFDTVSPQNKAGNDRYHIWTDWAGRREMLDMTVLGEPLINYTYYRIDSNGNSAPLKATFRFPFPASFMFNFNTSSPACTGNQLLDFFIYRQTESPAGATLATLAEFQSHDFAICHRSIYPNMTRYNTGWSVLYPDVRIFGTTWNRWVDSATAGPYTYARFYLLQNNFTPFSREYRFYPYMTTQYGGSRETMAAVNFCPDVERGYNGYYDMLNNITKTTIDAERKTSGTYDCIVNLARLIDNKGADKTEFILTQNSTVFWGEVRRQDEPYPTTAGAAGSGYTQTAVNKATYWYGNWTAVVSPQPYAVHGYGTTGNPQFQDYIYYYQAPQQYFNKVVFDESYFWDKNNSGLLGGKGVDIGSETAGDGRGFSCNLVAGAAGQYDSLTRKGWTHLGTSTPACPYSAENMKHYVYARPSFSYYISLTTGGSIGADYDFYIFGKNNYSAQVGTHNSLFDYLHNPGGTSTDPQDVSDLNESERHMNKQPWMCYESSRINRSFCLAYTSTSSFIYSAQAGAANEQALWGEDYSSVRELDRFSYYSNARWLGGSYYPYDYRARRYVYQYLGLGEFDINLLYAGSGASEYKMGMVFPDAWKPLMQGYLQGFDAGNRFWVYFDRDSRQYAPVQAVAINGTLYKNDRRLNGSAILLTMLKSDGTFVSNAAKSTDSAGRFDWNYTLPASATSGLYYIQASYNSGEIINKFGFRISTNVVTVTTDASSYERGDTVATSFTVKDFATNNYKDPDQTVLRYYAPDSSVIRCAKYPSAASVSDCVYNITRAATGQYSDSLTLSASAQLGTYTIKITTTDTGVSADFYKTFPVAQFTGWIDVSINNTIVGTTFTSNVTTTNTGSTPVTKTVEVTVPTSCGYITSVTNATGSAVTYNINDLSGACKVYWDVTLQAGVTTWFRIQATLPSSSGAYPGIEIDAPSVINTNTNFGIAAFVRNTNGVLANCDSSPLLLLKDSINNSIILNGVTMTNVAAGQYNYTTSVSAQSVFLAQANCSIGSTVYISNPKIISSQNVSSSGGGGGSASPAIELSASTPIATSTTAGIGALVKSSTGIPVSCDGNLGMTIRNIATASLYNGTMTNFGIGMYNFSWTTPATASVFYVNASCAISGTSYTGFTLLSTQQANASTDYNQMATFVWSYTSRNLTYYNQSVAENLQSCLQNAQCSGWWMNTTLAGIQNTVNLINSTANQINSSANALLGYFDCTSGNEVCTRLQNIMNNATDIQSRVYSLNASQIPQLKNNTDSMLSDTNWLRANVSTQANVTEILGRISDVQSNATFIKNNMFQQGNATGAFLVDYLSTVFIEPGNRAELWVLTTDLLGSPKTVSSAACNVGQKGVYVANGTISISSGGVYAYWNASSSQATGEYYWNCTLTGSTLNLQAPFFVSATAQQINQSISQDFNVRMSDFGTISAGQQYRASIYITDYLGRPINASSTPAITLYDPLRNIIVSNVSMAFSETGIYTYNFSTSSTQTAGQWEAVAKVAVYGITQTLSDFWELASSPAQVKISSIADNTIPTIVADVTITNEGGTSQEYQYEYCVVANQTNQCGGDDDTDYASGAKLVQAGQSWNTQLSLDRVNQTGDYWFKVVVYYGTQKSGASKAFTAVQEAAAAAAAAPVVSSGGGGGAAQPKAEVKQSVVVGGSVGTFDFSSVPEIAVTAVELSVVATVTNVKVTVEKMTSAQTIAQSAPAPAAVFQYVSIKAENVKSSDVSAAKLRFKVPKQWLGETNAAKDDIAVFRFASGWNELPTKIISEDSQHVYYEAESPGFSVFAVGISNLGITYVEKEVFASKGIPKQAEIKVRNTGNADVVVSLSIEGLAFNWYSMTDVQSMKPSEEKTFTVVFDIPSAASGGSYDFYYAAKGGGAEKRESAVLHVLAGKKGAVEQEIARLKKELADLTYTAAAAKQNGIDVSKAQVLLDIAAERLDKADVALDVNLEDAKGYLQDAKDYMLQAKLELEKTGIKIEKKPAIVAPIILPSVPLETTGIIFVIANMIVGIYIQRKTKREYRERKEEFKRTLKEDSR